MYDPQGLLAPLTLKMKKDLRQLIKIDPSWMAPISTGMRSVWIKNFCTVEDVRKFLQILLVATLEYCCSAMQLMWEL